MNEERRSAAGQPPVQVESVSPSRDPRPARLGRRQLGLRNRTVIKAVATAALLTGALCAMGVAVKRSFSKQAAKTLPGGTFASWQGHDPEVSGSLATLPPPVESHLEPSPSAIGHSPAVEDHPRTGEVAATPIEESARKEVVRDVDHPPVTFALSSRHVIAVNHSPALKVSLSPSAKYVLLTAGRMVLDARLANNAPAERFVHARGGVGRQSFNDFSSATQSGTPAIVMSSQVFALIEGASPQQTRLQVVGAAGTPIRDASSAYLFVLTDRSRAVHSGRMPIILRGNGPVQTQVFNPAEHAIYVGDDEYLIQVLDPHKVYDVTVKTGPGPHRSWAAVLCALRTSPSAEAKVIGASGIGGQQYFLAPNVRYRIAHATEAKFVDVGLDSTSVGEVAVEVVEANRPNDQGRPAVPLK